MGRTRNPERLRCREISPPRNPLPPEENPGTEKSAAISWNQLKSAAISSNQLDSAGTGSMQQSGKRAPAQKKRMGRRRRSRLSVSLGGRAQGEYFRSTRGPWMWRRCLGTPQKGPHSWSSS